MLSSIILLASGFTKEPSFDQRKPDYYTVTVVVSDMPFGQNLSQGKVVLIGNGSFGSIEKPLSYSTLPQEITFRVNGQYSGYITANVSFKLDGCNYLGSNTIFDTFTHGEYYQIDVNTFNLTNCY